MEGEEELGAWRERRCELGVVFDSQKTPVSYGGIKEGVCSRCISWAPGKREIS